MGKGKSRFRKYLVEGTAAVGYAVFVTVALGIILIQLARIPMLSFLGMYNDVLSTTSPIIGCAIGAAVGMVFDVRKTVMAAVIAVGALGYKLGGPLAAYIAVVAGLEVGNLLAGKTSIELVLVPVVVILMGRIAALIVGTPMAMVMSFIGRAISYAAGLHPILMGIIVAVAMGLLCSSPLSAALICVSLGLSGIAAGAATVGCCVFTLGFAVTSFDDNGFAGLISQGLGSSVFQWENILRHPSILIPEVIVSAILGPVSTTLLIIVNNAWGAGIGGIAGPISAYFYMMASGEPSGLVSAKIAVILIIVPMLLTFLVSALMKKQGYIKKGYMMIYTSKK